MIVEAENTDDKETSTSEFPEVPEEAIVKPEENGYKAMLVATSREAAVTYKRELDKLNAPKSKIIMTSHLGEKGKDGTSWDEYFLTSDQREEEADRFKSPDDPNKILNVVDMLLVGYVWEPINIAASQASKFLV